MSPKRNNRSAGPFRFYHAARSKRHNLAGIGSDIQGAVRTQNERADALGRRIGDGGGLGRLAGWIHLQQLDARTRRESDRRTALRSFPLRVFQEDTNRLLPSESPRLFQEGLRALGNRAGSVMDVGVPSGLSEV
jgi:hypothetical protein